MAKKTVYIHVGYPKTGTTTFQKHFFPKIEEIQYLGKFDGEDKLFLFDQKVIDAMIFKKSDEIDFENIRHLLENVILENRVLLSEESILFNSLRASYYDERYIIVRPEDVATNIRKVFDEKKYDVKILISIRRQDEMLTSLYAQSYTHYYSKQPQTNTFAKFYHLFTDKTGREHPFQTALDYDRTVSQYQALFGTDNVHLLVFEALKEQPEAFYRRLCEILEIDPGKYQDIAIKKQENRRSTEEKYKKTQELTLLEKLYALRQKYLPSLKIGLNERQRAFLQSIVLSRNDQINKTIFLTDAQKKEILSQYKYSNQHLSKIMDLHLEKYGYYHD